MQRGLFKEYLNPVRLLSSKLLRLSLSDTGSPVWGTTECPITHYLRHSLFVRFHVAAPRQKIPSLGNFCELLFQPPSSSSTMEYKTDKETKSFSSDPPHDHITWYDPSKESAWTRAGLTFESFKPASGPVRYVPVVRPMYIANIYASLGAVRLLLVPTMSMPRIWRSSRPRDPCCNSK